MKFRTVTGKDIDLLNLKPGDIDINTIARGLAKQVRYNGQGNSDLTVLTHSMWVAHRVEAQDKTDQHTALVALLHDATEAYISDIFGGVKAYFRNYRQFEKKLFIQILNQLGIKQPTDAQLARINRVDKAIVSTEKHLLFKQPGTTVKNATEEQFIDTFCDMMTVYAHNEKS